MVERADGEGQASYRRSAPRRIGVSISARMRGRVARLRRWAPPGYARQGAGPMRWGGAGRPFAAMGMRAFRRFGPGRAMDRAVAMRSRRWRYGVCRGADMPAGVDRPGPRGRGRRRGQSSRGGALRRRLDLDGARDGRTSDRPAGSAPGRTARRAPQGGTAPRSSDRNATARRTARPVGSGERRGREWGMSRDGRSARVRTVDGASGADPREAIRRGSEPCGDARRRARVKGSSDGIEGTGRSRGACPGGRLLGGRAVGERIAARGRRTWAGGIDVLDGTPSASGRVPGQGAA